MPTLQEGIAYSPAILTGNKYPHVFLRSHASPLRRAFSLSVSSPAKSSVSSSLRTTTGRHNDGQRLSHTTNSSRLRPSESCSVFGLGPGLGPEGEALLGGGVGVAIGIVPNERLDGVSPHPQGRLEGWGECPHEPLLPGVVAVLIQDHSPRRASMTTPRQA